MDSFETLLDRHRNTVERFVKYRIPSAADADDVVQETYIAAYRSFASVSDTTDFRAWILGIARHKCADWFRRCDAQKEYPSDRLCGRLVGRPYGNSARSAVRDTLAMLDADDREVLSMYYLDELPQRDIAHKLGIPHGTVKSRLHYARHSFMKLYPYPPKSAHYNKGGNIMRKLPFILPDYTITHVTDAPFEVRFEELCNWFIVPRLGEKLCWGTYDIPSRRLNEISESEVIGKIVLHGIEGVEIVNIFTEFDGETVKGISKPHTYYAQLTDTHCRWLGESYYDKNGAKQFLTFLDGDEFMEQWELGEDNCGNETRLVPKGDITRVGNEITAADKKYLFDVVGRYDVTIGDMTYETVLAVMIYPDGAMTETYIDRNGRTVLWRRFNRDDWSYSGHSGKWSESHPDNERVTVNGDIYVHWYDCISDYII